MQQRPRGLFSHLEEQREQTQPAFVTRWGDDTAVLTVHRRVLKHNPSGLLKSD